MLWLKALHVMAVIAWMAGLFYLPRLFVYHAEARPGSDAVATFKVMEERLLRIIMRPAMLTVWMTGAWLVYQQHQYASGWFHAKLLLVIVMTGLHGMMSRWRKDFAADRNTRSSRFFRIANEVPTVLMAAIVILVIVKPF